MTLTLDNAIAGIPKGQITQAEIGTLYAQTDKSQYDLLDRLVASYTAGQTVLGTYEQVKAAFAAVDSKAGTLSSSIDTVSSTLKAMSEQINGALTGSGMMTQLQELSEGMSALSTNYESFHSGLLSYLKGLNELAAGYARFDAGVASFSGGMDEFYIGTEALVSDTGQLKNETAGLPEKVQSEIDSMISQYSGADFAPISFVSPKNKDTSFVQFVFKSDEIAKPETPK